jgi:cell filamentation protein
MDETLGYNTNGETDGLNEGGVLKNKLDIKNQEDLEDAETVYLKDSYEHFTNLIEKEEVEINLSLLFDIHEYFLGDLYEWAGKIREVNLLKGETLFVPPENIKQELNKLKSNFDQYLPKSEDYDKEVAEKLAYLHCELNVIHPFRDGNGRTIRLFINLIALDAGYNLISFDKVNREDYLQASKDCMTEKYSKMKEIILRELKA